MNEDYPTWTNTHADVATYAHGRTISSFITDIVHPSVAKLEDKTEAYRHSAVSYTHLTLPTICSV